MRSEACPAFPMVFGRGVARLWAFRIFDVEDNIVAPGKVPDNIVARGARRKFEGNFVVAPFVYDDFVSLGTGLHRCAERANGYEA